MYNNYNGGGGVLKRNKAIVTWNDSLQMANYEIVELNLIHTLHTKGCSKGQQS